MSGLTLAGRTLDVSLGGRFVFGAGAVAGVADAVRAARGARVLLVTDRGVVAAGIAGRVTGLLDGAGITVVVFDGVEPNPTTANIRAGAAALVAADAAAGAGAGADAGALASAGLGGGSVVVALGGGSAMDAAKGIALAAANPGVAVVDLDYRNEALAPGLPLVAIPTTAGTGSETNAFGVITNEAQARKFYVGNESCRPRLAILDPELTLGLPAGATAATGVDALSHALEGLMAKWANPLSTGIALEAIAMIAGALEAAVADGSNLEARAQLLLAAHLAGIAQGMTGLGLAHAIAHPLGGRLNVPHGAALAAVLPTVLRYNAPVSGERLARAAAAMGVRDAADGLDGLIARIGLARRLGEFGVTPALAETLADDAVADVVINNTPRMPDRDEVRDLVVSLI